MDINLDGHEKSPSRLNQKLQFFLKKNLAKSWMKNLLTKELTIYSL